jgi:hypothetical protein
MDGAPCDDGDACTTGDHVMCSANKLVCVGQQGVSCEDQNPCTVDVCNPVSGCMHVIDSRPPDRDGDGVTDACDVCPAASNASQLDTDRDGLGDACDNCPTMYNPGQNPDDCLQAAHELTVSRSSASGKGSGTITWTTTHEFSISGFNIQQQEHDGTYARLNPTPIPCLQCITGQGATYAFTVPKLKSGRNLFIHMLGGTGDLIGIFGPAPDPSGPGLTRN